MQTKNVPTYICSCEVKMPALHKIMELISCKAQNIPQIADNGKYPRELQNYFNFIILIYTFLQLWNSGHASCAFRHTLGMKKTAVEDEELQEEIDQRVGFCLPKSPVNCTNLLTRTA